MEKEVFAKGICFKKLFFIFVIGSIFGAIYEELLTCFKLFVQTGSIIWTYRRGVIYGPFSPIYGAGAVLFIILLARKKNTWHKTFLYGGLIGGGFEYLISVLQELVVGSTSWDYSQQFLNIGGRTTIPFMIFWGFLAALLVHVVYPYLSEKIENIPTKLGEFLFTFLLLFLTLDMLISWTAVFRQNLRKKGIPPITKIGVLYDEIYPDEFLKKYYTNMEFK